MSFQLKFGVLDLTDIAEWREAIPSRVVEHTFPRRQGSVVPLNPAMEARRIALTGEIVQSSETTLNSYLADLSYQLSIAGRQPLYLRDDERFYRAVKETFSYRFYAGRSPATHAAIEIGFLADDPHLYAPTASEQTDALTGTSGTFLLTNNGRAGTPPVLELTRSAGTDQNDVLITHTATGYFFKVSGNLVVGTKLIFDFVNRRVVQGGNLAMHLFTGLITFELRPGLNNFAYSGPGNVSIFSTWHERYP